jgi:hypothetical protein
MYKSRSESMQRGSQIRDGKRMSKEAFFSQTNITMAKDEVAHFQLAAVGLDQFIEALRPIVRSAAKNGFRKPSDVSRLLNKWKVTTACGSQWSPRLTWFLLRFLFDAKARLPQQDETRRKRLKTKNTKPVPVRRIKEAHRPKSTASSNAAPPTKLTRDEMAARLELVGRVVLRKP